LKVQVKLNSDMVFERTS